MVTIQFFRLIRICDRIRTHNERSIAKTTTNRRGKNENVCGGKVELIAIVVNSVSTIFTLWLICIYFDVDCLEIDSWFELRVQHDIFVML